MPASCAAMHQICAAIAAHSLRDSPPSLRSLDLRAALHWMVLFDNLPICAAGAPESAPGASQNAAQRWRASPRPRGPPGLAITRNHNQLQKEGVRGDPTPCLHPKPQFCCVGFGVGGGEVYPAILWSRCCATLQPTQSSSWQQQQAPPSRHTHWAQHTPRGVPGQISGWVWAAQQPVMVSQ